MLALLCALRDFAKGRNTRFGIDIYSRKRIFGASSLARYAHDLTFVFLSLLLFFFFIFFYPLRMHPAFSQCLNSLVLNMSLT